MSADLLDQLAQYGADHRARQALIEVSDIRRHVQVLHEPAKPPRHRFSVLAAMAAVVLVVVGGLLVIDGFNPSEPADTPGTDLIRSVDPTLVTTTTSPPATTAAPTTTVPAQTETTVGPPEQVAPVEVRPSISANVVVGEPMPVAGTPSYYLGSRPALGAWNDGFLLVTKTGGLPMAATLSDEMQARFPDEVLEAYPDGLQGTMVDVIARLQEDGLIDEVMAALAADPELNEAVNSGPTSPVEFGAEFSVDGEVWTPMEIVAPPGIEVHAISIIGGRLVVVGTPTVDPLPREFRTMVVASSIDLSEWSTQTVPDVVETLGEVSFAMNDRGWVAHIEPDQCNADGDCHRPARPSSGYDVGEGPPLTWAAAWGAEPVSVDGAVADEGAVVRALADGFVAQHDIIECSRDGVTWAPVPQAPTDVALVGALPLDDGGSVVVTWAASCETQMYNVDPTGRGWERIDVGIDDAPRGLLPASPFVSAGPYDQSAPSSAAVFDTSGPFIETTRWEQNGLELTMRTCNQSGFIPNSRSVVQYEVVEVDSGETLLSETKELSPQGDVEPFDFLTSERDGIVTVRDPATGDLVFVDDFENNHFEFSGQREDPWLLVTTNGTDWLVDDLVQITDDPSYVHAMAAIRNGDTVLVATEAAWLRYHLPDR